MNKSKCNHKWVAMEDGTNEIPRRVEKNRRMKGMF